MQEVWPRFLVIGITFKKKIKHAVDKKMLYKETDRIIILQGHEIKTHNMIQNTVHTFTHFMPDRVFVTVTERTHDIFNGLIFCLV